MRHSVLQQIVWGMALAFGACLSSGDVYAQSRTQPDPNVEVQIYQLENPEQYYSDTVGSMYTAAADEINKTNNGAQQGANPGAQAPYGAAGMPFLSSEQQQPEPEIIYQYDKKAVEGFYGVPLPKRLFNNVPSDW